MSDDDGDESGRIVPIRPPGTPRGRGRPPGPANKAPKDIRNRLLLEGESPLEIIVDEMRFQWRKARNLIHQPELEDLRQGYMNRACELALQAAPYFHPKLTVQSIDISADTKISYAITDKPLTPAEWMELYGQKSSDGSGN